MFLIVKIKRSNIHTSRLMFSHVQALEPSLSGYRYPCQRGSGTNSGSVCYAIYCILPLGVGVGVDFEVVLVCVDLGVGHGKEPVGEFHIRALSAAQRGGACVAGSGTPGMALSY